MCLNLTLKELGRYGNEFWVEKSAYRANVLRIELEKIKVSRV